MSLLVNEICDKTKYLLGSSEYMRNGDDSLKSTLQLAIADLTRMQQMLFSAEEYLVAFAGRTNVGKSTLLNALLGEYVAPARNRPYSALPVEYSYSESQSITLSFNNDFRKRERPFHTPEELVEQLTQLATEGGEAKAETKLLVHLRHPLLQGGVVIADTPGFGATDGTDSEAGLHDEVLVQYLTGTPALQRIFWITGDSGPAESELKFFFEHFSRRCLDLIVNLHDGNPCEERRREFENKYRPELGVRMRFHYINAKAAVRACRNSDPQQEQASGLYALKEILQAMSTSAGREKQVLNELRELYIDIGIHFSRFLHKQMFWPPVQVGVVQQLLTKLEQDWDLYDVFSHVFSGGNKHNMENRSFHL